MIKTSADENLPGRCAWMAVGTFHGTTYNIQVRLPLAFAMLGPAALLVGLPFIPGM